VRARLSAITQAVEEAIRRMPLPLQLSLRGLPARLASDAQVEAEVVLCNIAEGRWAGPDGVALRPMLRAAPLHSAAPPPPAAELPPLLPDIEQRHPVALPASTFAPGANALAVELALLDGQGRVVRALRQDWPVEIAPAEAVGDA